MARLHRQPICVASALLVPMAHFATPPWLGLAGVPPCWAVLWLLPWALVDGPVSGALAGAARDRAGWDHPGWFDPGAGADGSRLVVGADRQTSRSDSAQFQPGPARLVGNISAGADLLLQFLIVQRGVIGPALQAWGVHTLLCQTLVTASSGRCWHRCSCCSGDAGCRCEATGAPAAKPWFSLAAAMAACNRRVARPGLELWTLQLAPRFNAYFADVLAHWQQRNPNGVRWTDLPWGSVERKLLAAVFAGPRRMWSTQSSLRRQSGQQRGLD